ncbi:MAG: formate--tetrahydrofolate ligase [Defluviitaleaceae bacterium]|nr:formate--tetrahydrofolate ligase [Defluviitaleaceae bacterium]MCL2239584.1 formate--tetrahydrofolate ligase [Defluviitaleaceae bacterium]
MRTDIEIAQATSIVPIGEIATKLEIPDEIVSPFGRYKAKINHRYKGIAEKKPAKVILVTAISPTPAGEGKTTTTVGLGDALARLGKRTMICLREPSLGPVFGVKGGAAGGGYAQIVPMEDINLHFTGDLHAITTANNLLAALVDNHIQQGNILDIDPRQVTWRRAMDMNDRQLRYIINGLGGKANGQPREDGFDITAASEVMAVFCLSENLQALKENLARIVVGYSYSGKPITAGDLQAQGAMAALLKEAFDPNLVQTLEGTPALVHGGPFANIAHGCNTAVATKLAMALGEYVVTEAGFGADLGAEKFINIKCRRMGIAPSAVVLVATIRALKHHGGVEKADLGKENLPALEKGMANLRRHISNITQTYGLPCVVAVNRFPTDTEAEIAAIKKAAADEGVACALSEVHAKGGAGGEALAQAVLAAMEEPNHFRFTYEADTKLKTKMETIARKVYRADGITFAPEAAKQMRNLEKLGYGRLPVCMAKTQYSFSDDAKKLGAAEAFTLTVRQVRLCAGAGFVVAITGDIMTMPGLPKIPSANHIDLNEEGVISGLF